MLADLRCYGRYGNRRIESGTPRRKITLDEALGFARVFELPLEELMSPPLEGVDLEGVDLEGRRVVQEAVEAFYASRDAEDRLHQAVVAIADYLRTRPDASNGVHEQCLRLMGEECDARALTDYIESGGYYH